MGKSDSDAPCGGLSVDGLKTMIWRGWIMNEWIDELVINEFRMHKIKNEEGTHRSYFRMGTRTWILTLFVFVPNLYSNYYTNMFWIYLLIAGLLHTVAPWTGAHCRAHCRTAAANCCPHYCPHCRTLPHSSINSNLCHTAAHCTPHTAHRA
jgi:hypothetical protein